MKKGGREKSFMSSRLHKQIGSTYNTGGVECLCTDGVRFWTPNSKVLHTTHVKSETIKILREGTVCALIWIDSNRMLVELCRKTRYYGCNKNGKKQNLCIKLVFCNVTEICCVSEMEVNNICRINFYCAIWQSMIEVLKTSISKLQQASLKM